ncbi:hypothetical protein [Arthrobacter sp. GMC3]|uniref:hypothetical protein n=1 Tax=Arthrobacter sp. GMC3 TaxID=2058894 RepID=UPI0015E2CF4E|nr:hypothetical protein [Arthrobacter sp. GMC3]
MSQPVPISRLLRHPVATSESLESSALLIGAAVFVVTTIVALLTFAGHELPISGRGSVGQFVALGSATAAATVFVMARVLLNTNSTPAAELRRGQDIPSVRLHWYDIGALALAHAFIALLGWLGIADLMGKSFTGALIFTLPGAVLAAVAIAVSSYAVFLSAVNLTPISVSVILVVFLVAGALTSMLSATDPLWWQKNLSTLGISDDISALAFNLTLIIAGVVVTTIAHYATVAIPVGTAKEVSGRNLVRGALVLIGVLLACVGIFPVDRFLTAHNVAASGMAAVYVALVLGLRRFVPAMPGVFILLGYVFVGVIVVLAVFFATGYYNLTAVELVAFLLIFSWLILLIRNTGAMTKSERSSADQESTLVTGASADAP